MDRAARLDGLHGTRVWFYGSGEGGELQIEIGEDKTSDVERYRAPAFYDRDVGWQRIRLPFSTFRPGDYNPVPGNGILDLKAVYNLVFAANSGESIQSPLMTSPFMVMALRRCRRHHPPRSRRCRKLISMPSASSCSRARSAGRPSWNGVGLE